MELTKAFGNTFKPKYMELKHLKTFEQNTDKNLNISDIIERLSEIQRYNMVEGGNSIHRLIHAEKNDNGEWIHYSVIDEITKMLKQIKQ